ncbi:hypothetical protein PG985_015066 [Apiospora marii]|uniref:uncharacterized protein n=1 Tax=Apiospora marii TaxID=335849 RepID=UPI0031301D0A
MARKEELRQMLINMHEAWKALEKDQDGVPKDIPLYSEKMRKPMRDANSKILQAVQNFISKDYKTVDDSDYKLKAKWYLKLGIKVIGALIGIALALSTDGLRKLLKLDQRPPQVTVNLTINTGSAASAGTNKATEGQFPAPVDLNLHLDALSLGQNQDPFYIEVRQTAPSDKTKAAPPHNDKATVRDAEDL